jgi:hypothetical protein
MSLNDLFNYLWNTNLIIMFYDLNYLLRIIWEVIQLPLSLIIIFYFLIYLIIMINDHIKSKKIEKEKEKKKYPY